MNLSSQAGGKRGALALAATGGLLATVGFAGLGPVGAQASSHREAPIIAGLPQYDNTDVYAFRSPDRQRSVTLVANWIPFEEPAGGPNFYPFATDARYNVKVDNDGDARADVVYTWKFKNHYRTKQTFLYNTGVVESINDPDLNFRQTYRLTQKRNGKTKVLGRNLPVAPSNVGQASMPDYPALRNQATKNIGSGTGRLQTFAGQADDPFFLDLRVFDLLYGGDFSEAGDDTLAGFNVNSVALQVPRYKLAHHRDTRKNPVIGVWSTTDRKNAAGKYRQVSRLGNPLVNEVVILLKDKNKFNRSVPKKDAQFLEYVTDPYLPKVVEAVYGIKAPETPRNDLVSVFLTGVEGLNQPKNVTPSEQLRLNMTTPVTDGTADERRLGVIAGDTQGFPNGRRLSDDVLDIALQVVEGELVGNKNDLADGVNSNDRAFMKSFPYLALPHSGSNPDPHNDDTSGTSSSADSGAFGWLPGMSDPAVPGALLSIGLLTLMGGLVSMVRRRKVTVA
ncbi:MAG: FIG01130039: hypothetical protein [uncultured Nocardioidaceae bacterium]|uniref:DUF4331 domain-containing protein n=1 Tax=uncultured Nocardioidaceae bacterium TaxID=253824 RepID=A0A6J4LCJ2_9ACTN|nr:MAG: FIG01130039: hypothetical protein [uncultured Nocardioidaceae bacterium]